jgi:hypothetical protein
MRTLPRCIGFVLAVTLTASVGAQTAPRLARVEGIAYDSLTRSPLRQAFVSVGGTGLSTLSDDKGRFRLDSVPEGLQQFTMQHAVFDTLGLSGVTARVVVQQKTPRVTLAVPSFATLWRAACGDGPAPRDSALVYGSVRLTTQGDAIGVAVDASWVDLIGGGGSLATVSSRRWRRSATTDDSGEYALCGVPLNTPLTLQAALDTSRATSIALTPTTTRVRRHDLLVAPKRIASAESEVTTLPLHLSDHRASDFASATVTGVVTNAAGMPLANAAVAVDTLPEVRTGQDGRFFVPRVPVGTRQAAVVLIGMQPYSTTFDVRVGDTVKLVVPMSSVQTLSEVRVKANTVVGMRERTIEEHKRLGLGTVRDSTEIETYANMQQAVRSFPFLTVTGTPARFRVSAGVACQDFSLVLDGHPMPTSQLAYIDNKTVAVMEVYRRLYPSDLIIPKKCVIVVWTKAGLNR